MTDPCDLSAIEARNLIGYKKLSPVELLDSCIGRIDAVNPAVNAICGKGFDRARVEAKESEEAVLNGDLLGPLHGLPLGVKDLLETEGLLTTHGSPLYKDYVPDSDHDFVAELRNAGAIVFCKTNTPEFGAGANTTNPVWGATGNPFDPKRICGGSSGGSAVALATNMMPIATGSDTGGSLRIPAAFCGIVSHRSTPGIVPNVEQSFGYTTFGLLGPMARTIDDMVLMYSTIVRHDPLDPLSAPMNPADFALIEEVDLSTLKVAVSEDLGFAPVDNRIRETFRKRVDIFKTAFMECSVQSPELSTVDRTNWILRSQSFLANFREKYQSDRNSLGPNVRSNYEAGLEVSAEEIAWATQEQTNIYRHMETFFDDVDILIAPTVPVPPFPVGQLYCDEINGEKLDNYVKWLSLTYGLSIPGNPVTTIPCGLEPTGTPFGLQICGRHYDDAFVIGVAKALERLFATDPRTARPIPDIQSLTV